MCKIGFYISAQKNNYIFAQLKITYLRKIITYLRRNYISAQSNYISAQKLHICAKITYLRITLSNLKSKSRFRHSVDKLMEYLMKPINLRTDIFLTDTIKFKLYTALSLLLNKDCSFTSGTPPCGLMRIFHNLFYLMRWTLLFKNFWMHLDR